MKTNEMLLRNKLKWVSVCAILWLPLAGCMDDEGEMVEPVAQAYVSIYNASPNAPQLDVSVDNRQIFNQPLNYTDYTRYLNFYTGDRALKISSFNANSVLVDTTVNFQADKAYSMFIADDVADLSAVVVEDNAETPAPGKALVRLVHLSPDAQAVDVTEENGTTLFTNQLFKQASAFKEVDADTYNLMLNTAGDTGEGLSVPDATFRSQGIYTLIVRGFATPPAGNTNTLSVQIVSNN